jgi:hypothetical protein
MAMTDQPLRLIFLAGPPGSGKSTLGRTVCHALDLRFLDFPRDVESTSTPSLEEVERTLNDQTVDVVALPWKLQLASDTFAWCRRKGSTVALWAHPLDMQDRSGHTTPLFTSVARLATHGGFGRTGTGCREFRKLGRACDHVLLLNGLSLEEAVVELQDLLEDLRLPEPDDPAVREGIDGWAEAWIKEHGADAKAAHILVDAMARYTLHLKESGASPRKMSAMYSDLDAAAMLVMIYEAPVGKKVLQHFSYPPLTYEFGRKFSDSRRAMTRYTKTLDGFASFLRKAGLISDA